jgi:hypothetical protein
MVAASTLLSNSAIPWKEKVGSKGEESELRIGIEQRIALKMKGER